MPLRFTTKVANSSAESFLFSSMKTSIKLRKSLSFLAVPLFIGSEYSKGA